MRNYTLEISRNGDTLGLILEQISPSTPKDKVLRRAQNLIAQKQKFLITTLNPEMVVLAEKNALYCKILLSSDIKLPDGIGLAASYYFLRLPTPKNMILRLPILLLEGFYTGAMLLFFRSHLRKSFTIIRGREIFSDFIQLANRKNFRVFLYGARGDVAAKTKKALESSFKSVQIESAHAPEYDENGVPVNREEIEKEKAVLQKINDFKPHMLFIGISPPKELLFLQRNWNLLNFTMAMHVGQTFDLYAGTVKRTPKKIANLGLEWLYRLLTGSKSLKRIWLSFPLFPLKVFWWKLQNSD